LETKFLGFQGFEAFGNKGFEVSKNLVFEISGFQSIEVFRNKDFEVSRNQSFRG
jgi:hypothetical protein